MASFIKEYVVQRSVTIPRLLEAFDISLVSLIDRRFLLVDLRVFSALNYTICGHKRSYTF